MARGPQRGRQRAQEGKGGAGHAQQRTRRVPLGRGECSVEVSAPLKRRAALTRAALRDGPPSLRHALRRQVVCELEAVLPPSALAAYGAALQQQQLGGGGDPSLGGNGTTLPIIISHMHDYFVHVAAQLEQVHNEVRRLLGSGWVSRALSPHSGAPASLLRHLQECERGICVKEGRLAVCGELEASLDGMRIFAGGGAGGEGQERVPGAAAGAGRPDQPLPRLAAAAKGGGGGHGVCRRGRCAGGAAPAAPEPRRRAAAPPHGARARGGPPAARRHGARARRGAHARCAPLRAVESVEVPL